MSAPALKASGKTDIDDTKVSKKVQKEINKREYLEKPKQEAKDLSKSMKCPACGGAHHARSSIARTVPNVSKERKRQSRSLSDLLLSKLVLSTAANTGVLYQRSKKW
ncbi:hypothetical protein [Parasitella parasitica]|uniref:Uncharacterized protein n=1 Tax=Parasitella parasitica TaxID=35722 RepID=A0A0B7N6E4_9FUNG|nr:hypothetical protein [Parasitella parasitica]